MLVDGQPRLRGARCPACGHATIPIRRVCPACRRDGLVVTAFGPTGRALSSVELHVTTSGNPAPYSVGMVTLEEGPTVFARVTGADGPDALVRLEADVESDNYWFVGATGDGPASSADDHRIKNELA